MAQTKCTVIVDGDTVEEILSFEYHSICTAVTDEASFTVDSKNRKYRDKLRKGQEVKFILQHPDVNGGQPTLRHQGRIWGRYPKVSKGAGNEIRIVSRDKGVHLEKSHAPVWIRINGKTYADICDPATSPFFDKSWGFAGVRFEGDIRRSLKLGIAAAKAQAQRALNPTWVVQTEPGDTAATKIVEYARRINLLLNVSTDGYVCLYLPNYTQPPLYSIRCRTGDDGNNVLEGEIADTADTCYTDVTVVGEQYDTGILAGGDPLSPNATKKRGHVVHEGALPFVHRHTEADGEMFENGLAQKQAEWLWAKGQFDAWSATYKLNEHHQGGHWFDCDTMTHVEDQELGLSGNFWVEAVHCYGSKQEEDYTTMVLRMPGLLSASFGVYPNPPIYRGNGSSGAPTAAP